MDLCEKPRKILHRELREGNTSNLTTTDTVSIRKIIFTMQVQVWFQSCPQVNRDEIVLLINDSENNNVAFSTQTNSKYLTECDVFYIDSTFKCCANHFTNYSL